MNDETKEVAIALLIAVPLGSLIVFTLILAVAVTQPESTAAKNVQHFERLVGRQDKPAETDQWEWMMGSE